MIKRTRSTPSGYTKPSYACYDCHKMTKSTLLVYRGGYTEHHITLVCRNGTGCHKGQDASEVRGMVDA